MKSKQIGIVAMAVLLVALIAVYLIVGGNQSADGESEDTQSTDSAIAVSSIKSQITSISYTNGDDEYSYSYDGAKWGYDADDKLPLDSDLMANITDAISAVEATKAIDGQDLSGAEFGLDSPLHTIRASCADGSVHVFHIGSYNRHASAYYLTYEGDSRLFLVASSFEALFKREPEDMLLLEKIDTINVDSVSKITADGPFGQIVLEITEKTDGEDKVKVYTHTNKEGGAVELEAEAARKIISAFSTVRLDKCADYYAEEEELEGYGLDTEHRTKIKVEYTVNVTSTSESTGATTTTKLNRECVYYFGRVTVTEENDETESGSVDTSTGGTASEDTSVSSDTSASSDTEDKGKTTEKTYLVLADSNMVFDVDLSGASAFFD